MEEEEEEEEEDEVVHPLWPKLDDATGCQISQLVLIKMLFPTP